MRDRREVGVIKKSGDRRDKHMGISIWASYEGYLWFKSGFTVSQHVCLIFMFLLHVSQI